MKKDTKFPNRRIHYSKEYSDFLKDIGKKIGYNVDKEAIINEIKNVLTNKNRNELGFYG